MLHVQHIKDVVIQSLSVLPIPSVVRNTDRSVHEVFTMYYIIFSQIFVFSLVFLSRDHSAVICIVMSFVIIIKCELRIMIEIILFHNIYS